MRLADFLIIGAMKAGTTTLYSDLRANPAVFMDAKEPHSFCNDRILTPEGIEEYAALFAGAEANQLCGEASTGYTKRPFFEGVAERVLKVLGKDIKLIYVVREPVARAVSDHYHIHFWDNVPRPINEVDHIDPMIINHSRYAMQLEPWLDLFGRDRIYILQFENFINDRHGAITSVSEFLGLPPRPELIDEAKIQNRTAGKPVLNRGIGRAIRHNPLYRRLIRPMISDGIKDQVIKCFLPKTPARHAAPTLAQVDYIIDQVHDDAERLRQIMGRSDAIWDFAAVRQKYELDAQLQVDGL